MSNFFRIYNIEASKTKERMVKLLKAKDKEKNKVITNIPLAFDHKFKKVFGDSDAIERLEELISLFFELPINDVKGNISILNNEKLRNYNEEKGGATDVYLKLNLVTGNERIDIEVSNKKLSQIIMDRNFSYNSYHLSTQLHRNFEYSKLEKSITICFDKGLKDKKYNEKKIIDKYELIDREDMHVFTDKLQIYHVDIAKCYKIWHNKKVESYAKHDQIMIYLGAMLATKNIEEFSKCLEAIPMDEEVKKDIESTNFDLNYDEDMMSWYSKEQDELAIRNGERAEARADGFKEGRDAGHAEGLAEGRVEGHAQGLEEGRAEGTRQRTLELAKKFKDNGVDVQIIAGVTGLSLDVIETL